MVREMGCKKFYPLRDGNITTLEAIYVVILLLSTSIISVLPMISSAGNGDIITTYIEDENGLQNETIFCDGDTVIINFTCDNQTGDPTYGLYNLTAINNNTGEWIYIPVSDNDINIPGNTQNDGEYWGRFNITATGSTQNASYGGIPILAGTPGDQIIIKEINPPYPLDNDLEIANITIIFGTCSPPPSGNGSVYGYVNYSINGSIAIGAIVWINQTDGIFNDSTITNSSGGYCFNDIPPGNYTLQAFLDNFHSEFRNISIYPGDYRIENLTLFEGSGPPSGNGSVCGYVRYSNGTPIVGATVHLIGIIDYFTHTNDTGFYIFDHNVSSGHYDSEVFIDGFPPQHGLSFDLSINQTFLLNFTINNPPPGNGSGGGGGGSNIFVQGIVREINGDPLPNVTVVISMDAPPGPNEEPIGNTTTTNDIGYYSFNLSSSGRYMLQASLDGYVTYLNWSLDLQSGIYWINITLTPFFNNTAYITGYIRDNNTGVGLGDAQIIFLDTDFTHMVEIGGDKESYSNATGYFRIPVNYSSIFNIIVFKEGYYAKMETIIVNTTDDGENITCNITLDPAAPDNQYIQIIFTDLDDVHIIVNRTIFAEAPVFRFALDFMPETGNSNQIVEESEITSYLQMLNNFGPTVNFTPGSSIEREEGPPDFLQIFLNLILDGSNIDLYVPGTLDASLENIVNTSVRSSDPIYFNASFDITLDGSIRNSILHNFTVSCGYAVLVNNTINISFSNFYDIQQTNNNTNMSVTSGNNWVTIHPGDGSIEEVAYAWITLNLNTTTASLPIVDTPIWHTTDTWTFNKTSFSGIREVTYYLQSKPLRRWDREQYLIPRDFNSDRYLCYELRKIISNPHTEYMVYASINNIDWIVTTEDTMNIEYIVDDLDFPLYLGKTWNATSWWGENVTVTVVEMNTTKMTGEGIFNNVILVNMTNAAHALVAQEWYSPSAKFFINRTRYQNGSIASTLNLLSHSFGPYIDQINGPYTYDTDGDGLYDGIYVNISLNTSGLTQPKNIRLEGPLYKESTGWEPPIDITWISYEGENLNNNSSPYYANITYSGSLIYGSETDGPYTGWLELRDKDEWGPAWDYIEFETDEYNYTDFERPGVVIANVSDFGNDTNNNSKYDYLTLNLTLNVTQPGGYEVRGSLEQVVRYGFRENWYWITGAGEQFHLINGTNNVSLNFNGQEIYDAGRSGTFRYHLEVVDSNWTVIYEKDGELNHTYCYDDFETPSIYFNQSYMEEDGQRDFINDSYLTVNVSIIVDSGTFNGGSRLYDIHGGLHVDTGDDFGDFITGMGKQVILHEGENIIPVNFDITDIYNYVNSHNYNGSFRIGLGFSDITTPWLEIDCCTYVTQNYTIDDLPEPPISINVYADNITDDNSSLTIYAYINITGSDYANRYYDFHGGVHWIDNSSGNEEWKFITGWGDQIYLVNGTNDVMLNFSGMEIHASGHNGPYMVWIGLDDWETHQMITHAEYQTQPYNYTNFSAPEVSFNKSYMSQNGQHDFINGTEYLTINVAVNVSTPGIYRLNGGLHIIDYSQGWENWIFIAGTGTPEMNLTPGSYIIPLNYEQGIIKNALKDYDYSGVLKAFIGIEDVENWRPIANIEYTTQSYTTDDFSGSGVQIVDGQCSIVNGNLNVTLIINASRNDTYRIHGGVHWVDQNTGWWEFITGMCIENQDITNGTYQYNFTFNGWDIYNSMHDGPYKIWMGIENRTTWHLLDEIEINTDPWSYTDFSGAAPDIWIDKENMSAGSVDYMNDTYLTVNVSIYKSTNGTETFWIDSSLEYVNENNGYREFITGIGLPALLTNGTNMVALNFNAGDIYDSGYDGPYHVMINLKNQSTWRDIDKYEYITQSYSSNDLPTPPVSFIMEDENPVYCYINGSYLTINVTINVTDQNYAGDYDLHGGVHYRTNEGWWQHITGTGHPVTLVNGTNHFTLNFNAGEIHQQLPDGYDDNLSVFMGLNRMGEWNEIARCDFMTQSFSKDDFPGPEVTMDWNGYYINGSYFTVNLSVNVTNANPDGYDIHGGVHWVDNSSGWEDWRFITGTGRPFSLVNGTNNISLNFNAGDINRSLQENGYHGPLQIWIGINEIGNWVEITHVEFGTIPYDYTDFPGPGLTINCTGDYISNNGDTLTINITITASSDYQNISLDLHSGLHYVNGWMWEFITGTGMEVNLTQSVTEVQLNFSGSTIRASGRDGPYKLWIGISEFGNWEDITHTEYETNSYSHTDFAAPYIQILEENLTDYNNNSQYLTINVTVNATQPGVYILEGDLHWKQGWMWQWITWTSREINITTPGNYTFALNFNGQDLVRAADETGWNGEQLYCWLAIRNITDWREITRIEDHALQKSYTPDDFGTMPIYFINDSISDRPLNTSGGGLPYNILQINVSVNITQTGDYTIHAGLFDPINDTLITTTSEDINATTTGPRDVSLNFTGTSIYKKHYNGTFEFRAKLLSADTHIEYDKLVNSTNHYSYTDFEEAQPEAVFNLSAPINDTNISGNLVISLNITVHENGEFQIYGELYNNDTTVFITYAINNETLSIDEHRINLIFNGSMINESGIDGPYELGYLRLSIKDNDGNWVEIQTEKDVHITSSYSHSDFGGGA